MHPLFALFGGTFDPIHYGHIIPVRKVAKAAALQHIIYIPAAAPPHRRPPVAAAARRLTMVRLALANESWRYQVCDMELRRRGASYTFDTVQTLRRRHPKRRYVLLLGLDALLGFANWHRWRELQRMVHIIAITRPGWALPRVMPKWLRAARASSAAELRRVRAGKVLFMRGVEWPLSSTEVRARIAAGEDASDLVPGEVGDYIRKHNLYATS